MRYFRPALRADTISGRTRAETVAAKPPFSLAHTLAHALAHTSSHTLTHAFPHALAHTSSHTLTLSAALIPRPDSVSIWHNT
ncbi:hypothetical protein [Acididesulfobacillus acetoxydans]|uniref:hypothetical protein n=1 Tax=Acididesulfobacillus acetoxydans TaxID=1561005 RepID=UPI001F112802|nr:hypothetical protein [Acididesulfobacillus acetoxydans]